MASALDAAPVKGPDVDDAKALFEHKPPEVLELDEVSERRLLRKIDLLLIPLSVYLAAVRRRMAHGPAAVFVCYAMQYYDKAVLSASDRFAPNAPD